MSAGVVVRSFEASGVVALDLRGSVDRAAVHVVDQSIARLVEQGVSRIVVNCRDLVQISPDGMGVFLSHLIKIRKAGGDIKFCAMSREARTVVGVLGLGKLLEIHETEEAALGEFERRDREREARERSTREQQASLAVDAAPVGADVCVLRFRGVIDRHTIDAQEAAIRRALAEGRAKLVVDCEGIKYINSTGIGIFLAAVARARAKGGDIRFCRMREGDITRTWFSMLTLQNVFQVFATEAEAIASYRGAS